MVRGKAAAKSSSSTSKKAKVEATAINELVGHVVEELDNDTEQEILKYLRKDRTLGPKVLGMLRKRVFEKSEEASINEGDLEEILPSTLNKWDLIGKARTQVLLQKFNPDLNEQITDPWNKGECCECLGWAMNVDPKSAIPNKKFGECMEYAIEHYKANDEPLAQLVFKEVVVGTGKKAIRKKVIDFDKVGTFVVDKEQGTLTHRKENLVAKLPQHMLEDASFAIVQNYSETKAMVRTTFNDTPVLRIFALGKQNIQNRPVYVATKVEARSSSGSPKPLKSSNARQEVAEQLDRRRLSRKSSNASSEGRMPAGSGGAV